VLIVSKGQYSNSANDAVTQALDTFSGVIDPTIEQPATPKDTLMVEASPAAVIKPSSSSTTHASDPNDTLMIEADIADVLQPSPSTESTSTPSLIVQSPIESPHNPVETHPRISDRPLILYAYSETKNARKNLEFFLAHGLHAGADFVFILNGYTDAASIIPTATNIRYVQRPNDCYDMGAYAEVLTGDDLYKHYKKFILLNASIRGPFLPYWAENCWSDMYLKRVTDEVKVWFFSSTGFSESFTNIA
jgi:hypothetical protein